LFDEVNALIDARAVVRAPKGEGLEAPHVPGRGVALKYLLSGLVRCGLCNRAMAPSASGTYETKAGEIHKYPSYGCPAAASGACPNRKRIPEPWLRKMVVETLLSRLGLSNES